jgi:hypothetical protein
VADDHDVTRRRVETAFTPFFLVPFYVGLAIALLVAMTIVPQPVSANHLSGPCTTGNTYTEAARENNLAVELGGKGKIQLEYPNGGPVANGGLVRSFFAWRNFDNFAEIGWKWWDIEPSDTSPKFFAFWRDQGAPRPTPWEEGGAGARDSWSNYKLDNDGGHHWTFHAGGNEVYNYTFNNMNDNTSSGGTRRLRTAATPRSPISRSFWTRTVRIRALTWTG